MRHQIKRPDTHRVLQGLKDFQRDTVDYAFKRMYEDDPPARRFLVADEVGLGKTLVAKGIVARAIDYLWDTDPDLRIDIIYICSNLAIARQNINRLNFTGRSDHPLPDRITLLPRDIHDLKSQKLNFVSFTPGTSFDLRSSHGRADERALLYWLLPENWIEHKRGAMSVLTGNSSRSRFEQRVKDFTRYYHIDEDLRGGFHRELQLSKGSKGDQSQPDFFTRFTKLADQLGSRERLTDEERAERAAIIGGLRSTLASSCLHALEPDLIILDEFQRFRDLLKGKDEASRLALKLFNWSEARVLLLSATPYKMYTVADEGTDEDHFTDFIQTVAFLQDDPARTEALKPQLAAFKRALFQFGGSGDSALRSTRQIVENSLRRIMVRTERLGVTPDRSGMLTEVHVPKPSLEPQDLKSYLALQQVARLTNHGDTLEYWKSAPYLLNFMDDYQLKRQFELAASGSMSSILFDTFATDPAVLLSREDIDSYRRIDPSNARLRTVLTDIMDTGAWSLFWLPPALPYYQLAGRYAEPRLGKLTKRLVFSSWQVVPKVVAALLSYEAERRLYSIPFEGRAEANTPDSRKRQARLLQFTTKDGRPARMAVMAMVYPSITLAEVADPWLLSRQVQRASATEQVPSYESIREIVRARLAALISELTIPGQGGGTTDERWYWAAPILLDLHRSGEPARKWWAQPNLATLWRGASVETGATETDEVEIDSEAGTAWMEHVEAARRLVGQGVGSLGSAPQDLADVLALLALASPGTVVLRSLARVTGGLDRALIPEIRNLAGQVGHSFLTLFNLPEITASLRHATDEDAYWQRALDYCAEGCLQAVMDEYAHVLVEWRGVSGKPWLTIAQEVAVAMRDALSVRAANVSADLIDLDSNQHALIVGDKARFRSRFAARFGGQGVDEARAVERQSELQKAFNSPFWPFVLCTTSVGQEGLDFHLYCHAVVHWNLPANPVDLEQREGRIHRYKGHAIRKNIAQHHALALSKREGGTDVWASLFQLAKENRDAGCSDLVPYWVYLTEGGARIERHVPVLPMSTDSDRAERLRRSLTIYRMAFGQSRQEDMVTFLLQHIPASEVDRVIADACIDLSPDASGNRNDSDADLAPQVLLHVEKHSKHDEREAATPGMLLDLNSLRSLLDRFGDLRNRNVPEEPEVRISDSCRTFTVEQFQQLLNRFKELHRFVEDARRQAEARHRERLPQWRDLLDRFSAIRSKHGTAALVSQYHNLLDEYGKHLN